MNKILINALFGACSKNFQKPVRQTRRLASTYKVVQIKEHGTPLEIVEKKQTKLKPSQVRVQVSYCSVNSVDCYKFKQGGGHFPFVPGYELSGEVMEVGNDIRGDQISVGEKVVGLSLENFGGLAQECVVSLSLIFQSLF